MLIIRIENRIIQKNFLEIIYGLICTSTDMVPLLIKLGLVNNLVCLLNVDDLKFETMECISKLNIFEV